MDTLVMIHDKEYSLSKNLGKSLNTLLQPLTIKRKKERKMKALRRERILSSELHYNTQYPTTYNIYYILKSTKQYSSFQQQ